MSEPAPALQKASYVRHPAQVVPPHVVGLDHEHVATYLAETAEGDDSEELRIEN